MDRNERSADRKVRLSSSSGDAGEDSSAAQGGEEPDYKKQKSKLIP